MTEHFTREEAVELAKAAGFEVRRGLGLRESVPEDVFAHGLINEEVTVLCNAAVTAIDKKREAQGAVTTQGDKAYKRGFSDGMKEAPTGESWIRAIDEAMVGAHIGVAEMADDYGTAKKKLNALICWSVQVDRDLSRAQAAPVVGAPDACVWTPDTDYETDVHYSACGEAWSFIEGGPKENNVRFCQGCGKPVVIASAQPQQKEG